LTDLAAETPSHGSQATVTPEQAVRRLPWALGAIALNSVFAYTIFAGPVLILLLAELGLSKTQVGLILACFPLTGVVAPLVGPAVARLGYKRIFLICWAARKTVAATLLLTPVVLARSGAEAAAVYAMVVFAVFALLRAIADTAYYPWTQDFVPDRIRGRYTALDNLLWTGFGFLTLSVVSIVIRRHPGLDGFMRCMAVGVPFGFASVACMFFIPGGAPQRTAPTLGPDLRGARATLRDANYVRFLTGLGLMGLALLPAAGFLPLFAKEVIGLSESNVVLLQNATLLGSLLSSYFWGWAADRVGSKPIMLAGVVASGLMPLLWLALPVHHAWSGAAALALALLAGLTTPAWAIGSGRLLFIELMPAGKQGTYTAVYYAWAGLTAAAGGLLSGRLLDVVQGLRGSALLAGAGGYALLFAAAALLAFVSLFSLSRVQVQRPQVGGV
jgi:MFS family permease